MRIALPTLFALSTLAVADIPAVPESLSPDGKIHAVMDVDRDSMISPEWKGESYPRIEVTEKDSGQVLASIKYFGAAGGDARPLREHVRISWRPDSKVLAVTIDDRFYSSSRIFTQNKKSKFVTVPFPSYKVMTGFTRPDSKHLRPRGRGSVEGWDKDGRLIYNLFAVPLPSLTGNDPLIHRIYLEVSAAKMRPVKVEHEKGEWRNGDWIPTKAEQAGADQPATAVDSKSKGKEKPKPETKVRSQ